MIKTKEVVPMNQFKSVLISSTKVFLKFFYAIGTNMVAGIALLA